MAIHIDLFLPAKAWKHKVAKNEVSHELQVVCFSAD